MSLLSGSKFEFKLYDFGTINKKNCTFWSKGGKILATSTNNQRYFMRYEIFFLDKFIKTKNKSHLDIDLTKPGVILGFNLV